MGKRAETRERIEAQVIEIGRRHLATDGAAGLSLRAVARELGMVSSAVYRYVASRDELLTLLLVDAYTELADAVDEARTRVGAGAWDRQVMEIAHAVRRWAVQHPARWALLYGSPVPGYHAPRDVTVAPGTRVVRALFEAIGSGVASGAIPDADIVVAQTVSADFRRLCDEFDFAGGDGAVARGFVLWAALIGAVSLEVFGQYGADTITDAAEVFDLQLRLVLASFATE
ncbi:TetR/AcrR family transcriptional regulator [Mycobacterium sp. ACS4331]|uniref:TetR/AcrR family transcriptional regulator n=1 Tax=Mycobacterium sp. ACS4331 TaxID=1834121 RepID=UPI0008022D87|nr:TetR/AcrR family transcriptional regulator [Mycobacterium sp. ACS4331]OBF19550.1 TetR family transcriptional regulator [Mycobacterium sp. ACS4331]